MPVLRGQSDPGGKFIRALGNCHTRQNTMPASTHRQGSLALFGESLLHLLILDECRGALGEVEALHLHALFLEPFRSAANRTSTGSTSGPQTPVEQHIAGS